MSDKLITVATYWDSIEAGLARGRLEAAGIRSFLADEQTVSTEWCLGSGAKLQVGDNDAEAALEILSDDDAVNALDEDFDGADEAEPIEQEPAAALADEGESDVLNPLGFEAALRRREKDCEKDPVAGRQMPSFSPNLWL